jgi:hypothetical protein
MFKNTRLSVPGTALNFVSAFPPSHCPSKECTHTSLLRGCVAGLLLHMDVTSPGLAVNLTNPRGTVENLLYCTAIYFVDMEGCIYAYRGYFELITSRSPSRYESMREFRNFLYLIHYDRID